MKIIYKIFLAVLFLSVPFSAYGARGKTQTTTQAYKPYYAENGSYKGEYSNKTYKPKNIYVEGYNRRDGSYTRGYYKSRKR